mmetsp:Transcript_62629/g.135991  ORF Transcript_62629/g.135991 Transcript_62629/m.135991 type:complete len:289 (+) Transcript_62629:94-960(+)|eukprot:CAMPEP_0170587038 /NCGR_PEP_ID=MMETSP0224-20130122/10069_1 /TAXON_ID=285029 /ORGANISM="Togula jolla, Strain CCCM 725" /LENGTH=288 /DNA_ID=CAMNT_0010910633 /DNA_START=43 /DNA_END=909 /DNA_ORIENTATION=+
MERSVVWRRALQLRLPPSTGGIAATMAMQRRWWWWDVDGSFKKGDKPATTKGGKSSYVWVKGQVPVVLLDNVRGVGRKGQIVSVKRGYARHHLLPKNLGLFGTWENIDMYADPSLIEDPALRSRAESGRGQLPFDWVDRIRLNFVRWAREDDLSLLLEPVTVWDVLQELSDNHDLDLLPGNVEMPGGSLAKIGTHEVPVRMAFRNPESATGKYSFLVEVVSQQSQIEELRREEMAKAVEESRRFTLPQIGPVTGAELQSAGGFDDLEDEMEEAEKEEEKESKSKKAKV